MIAKNVVSVLDASHPTVRGFFLYLYLVRAVKTLHAVNMLRSYLLLCVKADNMAST